MQNILLMFVLYYMLKLYFSCIGLNNIYKLISLFIFAFLNVPSRNFKIMSVSHVIFPWDGIAL